MPTLSWELFSGRSAVDSGPVIVTFNGDDMVNLKFMLVRDDPQVIS